MNSRSRKELARDNPTGNVIVSAMTEASDEVDPSLMTHITVLMRHTPDGISARAARRTS